MNKSARAARRLLGIAPVDRTGWKAGPWDAEEDYYVWEHAELLCMVLRHPATGSLNGYVGVPPESRLYAVAYDDPLHPAVEGAHPDGASLELFIGVHGGLTFSGWRRDEGGADYWFFGFDCNHGGDFAPHPSMERISMRGGTYRDIRYVRGEVNRLAEQLVKLEKQR